MKNTIGICKLYSTNLEELKKTITNMMKSYKIKNYVHLPKKTKNFTYRKTPCGRGYSTYQKGHITVHKALLLINSLATFKALVEKKNVLTNCYFELKLTL